MEQHKNPILKFLFFTMLSLAGSTCFAQVANFKENQVINLGGGERLQVIRCRGEAEQQQCEFKYYVNNKQVGKPFWLKSANIASGKKSTNPAISIAKTKPAVAKTVQPTGRPVTKDKPIGKEDVKALQSEMLAMAKLLAQQQVESQNPSNLKTEETAPKTIKNDLVSRNPFLLKPTAVNQPTAKQSPGKD